MDERKRRILAAIVALYAQAGEPVGSSLLRDYLDMAVSTATLRNEMAALTRQGLLEQPHTSAGRVPSTEGYRYYIENLLDETGALSAADRLFHTTLIRESGNRLLYQFYQQTETLFTAYSVRSFTARPDTPPHTLSEHRRILDAVLAGEGEAAREAMRLHLTIADQRISTIIREEETV